MAKIRARSENNKLFFEFRYRGVRCREQTSLKDTKANRKRLEKILEKIQAEIITQTFRYSDYFPDSKNAERFAEPKTDEIRDSPIQVQANSSPELDTPTFQEFSHIWMREQQVSWRLATQEVMTLILNKHLMPVFGAKNLHQINKAEILEFRAQLAEKKVAATGKLLSPKTINEVVGSLRAILNEAADRYRFTSPARNIKRLKVPKSDIQPFTLQEVSLIMNRCRPDYKNYFTVRLLTGMRTGEVHGLKWSQVDFERRQLLIRETYSKGRTEYTKTDGSQREIDLSPLVYSALKNQEAGTRHLSDYVFCNLLGNPIENRNFLRNVWSPMLRNLGFEHRRPYQCRHTAATLWLASGENPQWIARQLGHTNTEMLFRTYARFVPNLTRQDGSAFEQMLSAIKDQTVDSGEGVK